MHGHSMLALRFADATAERRAPCRRTEDDTRAAALSLVVEADRIQERDQFAEFRDAHARDMVVGLAVQHIATEHISVKQQRAAVEPCWQT